MSVTEKVVVGGLDNSGNEFFYTGKAGEGWISVNSGDAFEFSTLEAARRKAKAFNLMTPVHCLRFVGMWMVVSGGAQ